MKKCYVCGNEKIEETVIDKYHYTECGLDDIHLAGIKKYRCVKCDEEFIELPRLTQLHRAIGQKLCRKNGVLAGKEVTFLRKEMRKSGKEFALMLSKTAEYMSRIEHNQKKMSGSLDTLVRALYTIYICEGETVCEGALDAVAGNRTEVISGGVGIELTPSDWLMDHPACCFA